MSQNLEIDTFACVNKTGCAFSKQGSQKKMEACWLQQLDPSTRTMILKLGYRFHALLKFCSDGDDTVPLSTYK